MRIWTGARSEDAGYGLASGSSGNAYLVVAGASRVLLDAGLPAPLLERYLRQCGAAAAQLSGIFVSHEHSDHVAGVGALARRYRLPVFATRGTFAAGAAMLGLLPEMVELSPERSHTLGALTVGCFPVAHDAAEPVGFWVAGDGQQCGRVYGPGGGYGAGAGGAGGGGSAGAGSQS